MKIFTKMLCAAALLVAGQQASAQTLLDNYETTRLVNYPVAQGTLTEQVANPFSSAENNSPTVARFVRSATDQYSTIAIRPKSGKFGDVNAYRTGAQRLTLKFLSPGPDTRVNVVFQNKARVATGYPNGNYAGLAFAVTAAPANTWETLTFTFETPEGAFDPTQLSTEVDQIAMLIAPGSVNNGATYHFDDLRGPSIVAIQTSGPLPMLLDNFENTRLVDYPAVQGDLTQGVPNPASGTGNTSPTVARFVRSATDQYATIAVRTKSGFFADVSAYKNDARKMTLKFLSPGPGTRVQMVLQNAGKVAYPLGNYAGDFFATTSAAANTWETLSFDFEPGVAGETFDPAVTATEVDQIAILIAPGTTNNGATYHFDDLTGPALAANGTGTRTAQNATAAFAAIYPNPTSRVAQLPYSLKKSAVVSLAVFDNMGRRVALVLDQQRQPAGQFSPELNATHLAPGLYTCRLLVDGASLTRQLSVQ